MNLEAIAPIIEDIIRQSLYEQRYQYGFGIYTGKDNKVASGNLARSVQAKVVTNRDGLAVIQVLMAEYGAYVNSGRLPGAKGVPIKSLEQWIKDRHLNVKDIRGTAFGIQKNIKKNGIRPAPFIEVAMEKLLADTRITELLGEATYEELINALEGI